MPIAEGVDDPGTDQVSRKHWRAVALIVLAVIGLGSAGTAYMHSALRAKPEAAAIPPTPWLGSLMSYDFVTPSLGWVLERSGPQAPQREFRLFRTDDGGSHWSQQLMKQGTVEQGGIADGFVQFEDPTNGFMAVMWPQLTELYRTVDGGLHWDVYGLPSRAIAFPTISDHSHGWLLGLKQSGPDAVFNLYATGNGGSSWQQLPDPPADSVNMTFRGPAEGWLGSAAASPPHVYSSGDGGRTWQGHDLPQPPGSVPSGLGVTTTLRLLPSVGVVAFLEMGSAGPRYEFTSFDGAASWRYVAARPNEPIFGDVLTFQDSFRWWAIDGTALLKSLDAGQTWTQVSNALPEGLYACQVLDSEHAWALVGSQASTGLVRSDDGGLHWSPVAIPHWKLQS